MPHYTKAGLQQTASVLMPEYSDGHGIPTGSVLQRHAFSTGGILAMATECDGRGVELHYRAQHYRGERSEPHRTGSAVSVPKASAKRSEAQRERQRPLLYLLAVA